MKTNLTTKKLVCSGALLAVALVLPLLLAQVKGLGIALCPMHLPVMLCGFVCGWPWGLAVGLVAPLLRFLIFGMPDFITALGMTFELAGYGFMTGLLYKALPKKFWLLYPELVAAMVSGRALLALAKVVIFGVQGKPFTFSMFWTASVLTAVPGMICQLVLLPVAVYALKKAKLILNN